MDECGHSEQGETRRKDHMFFPWCTQDGHHDQMRVVGLLISYLYPTVRTVNLLGQEMLGPI